jgi:hypothetical protein
MVVPDNVLFSERDYLAPTVFTEPTRFVTNWNYYSTLDQAIQKHYYLTGQGGKNYSPAGVVYFTNNGKPQTFGINCDFYILKNGEWQLTSYKYLKTISGVWPPVVFRFLSPDGAGIYYSILNVYYFGLSATSIKSVPAAKLEALDSFYREIQITKYRYNALVGFLNTLGKKQLNIVEQQVFNEGMLLLNSMNQQIATVRGIEVGYTQTGAMGNPVILLIALIIILSAATAWTISNVVSEKEKTKRINDAYELNKWIALKKQEIAQQVTAGTISQQTANGINNTLDDAAGTANAIAANAAKNGKGVFGEIGDIVKWGVVGLVAITLLRNSKSNAKAN